MTSTHSTPVTPPAYAPQIRLYQNWLRDQRGLQFDDYDALWRWSTTDLNAFWQSIWDYFDLQSPTPHSAALLSNSMPGAQWFVGAQVNYAQQVFRHIDAADAAGLPALINHNEQSLAQGQARTLSWPELRQQVASLALHLQAHGLQPGDRVAAYLPNIPEAIVAFLAVVSLGGVWSICAPDMGTNAVLDRFKQIAPKMLIACDGVHYGGRDLDRRAVVAELVAALPSVTHVVLHDNLGLLSDAIDFAANYAVFTSATAQNDAKTQAFEPVWLPFDHPLWIVYSSGTTGLPKPIVHGHGGTVVVALALKCLHNDVGCSYHPNSLGERYHWYSSTGWVMWNAQMSGLLNGTTCCLFDCNPGGSTVDAAGSKQAPDWTTLWRFAAQTGVTFFGAGAAFFANCMKAGIDLGFCGELRQIRALGTTGSPLSEDAQNWGTQQFEKIGTPDIWWCNISGGTDFAGAFIGGNRELPLKAGEMQCRLMGCAVQAWDEQGQPVMDAVGELVCTQPIPSMPLYFWGDDANTRYLSSYFDMYPAGHGRQPGGGDASPAAGPVWRHGDWLKISSTGGCTIFGRSDATINRHGLRMGTSELYSAVEALPEVLDSMVVDLEYLGRESYMPLFVVLRDGLVLDGALRDTINRAIRTALSPRFLPNDIFQVGEVPRTLSGKKQELPIKKLLLGQPLDKVLNIDTMANPGSLGWFVDFARAGASSRHSEGKSTLYPMSR
jgi:acetoacetyl-CoA synthetase